jgi:hypothetical protein
LAGNVLLGNDPLFQHRYLKFAENLK